MAEQTIAPPLTPPAPSEQTAPGTRANGDAGAAREVAQDFETFFLAQVLNQLFAGIPTDGLLGGGVAEGVYRNMLNSEYAKVISRAGGVGVADAVYREILKLQEDGP